MLVMGGQACVSHGGQSCVSHRGQACVKHGVRHVLSY